MGAAWLDADGLIAKGALVGSLSPHLVPLVLQVSENLVNAINPPCHVGYARPVFPQLARHFGVVPSRLEEVHQRGADVVQNVLVSLLWEFARPLRSQPKARWSRPVKWCKSASSC